MCCILVCRTKVIIKIGVLEIETIKYAHESCETLEKGCAGDAEKKKLKTRLLVREGAPHL
jgi:hypothetical protein